MSIKKSLGLGLLLGLMAVVFGALPAFASAAPQITSPKGTTVPVGTTITAKSTNAKTVLLAGAGTIECKEVLVHGVVTANSGTHVHIAMDEELPKDSATGCTLDGVAITVEPTFTALDLTAAEKYAEFDFKTSTGLNETSKSTVSYPSPNMNASSIHVAGTVGGTKAGNFSGDFTATTKAGAAILWD